MHRLEKVYVVIVTYNAMRWAERCFVSLRGSNYPVAVVVVDNASTDGTVAFVSAQFPEVKVIANAANRGFGAANNQGIALALDEGADFVFLLNQDTWIFPETVGRLVDAMADASGYGIVSPLHYAADGVTLDAGFARYLLKDYGENPGALNDGLYPAAFINAAAWLVSRHCLQDVGGFGDLFYHYGEDHDYVQRIRYYGYALGFVPSARIVHDRPSNRFGLESAEKTTWYYSVGARARLADINKPYPLAWLIVGFWFLGDMAYGLLKGKWFVIPVAIRVFYTVFIRGAAAIIRYRKKIGRGSKFLFLVPASV